MQASFFVFYSLETLIIPLKYEGVVCFCSFFARLKSKNACKWLTYKRFQIVVCTQTRDRTGMDCSTGV